MTAGTLVDLGQPWRGVGPFLFTAHHLDAYPHGDEQMAPAGGTGDRALGADFAHPSGWSMYHGHQVPGFPAHPHRGFETITIVERGTVDHADSTGASARYGSGDVQWVTAGAGVSHSEMFPLLHQDRDNTLELYQVWLNLPARDKLVPPEFTMQWGEDIPVVTRRSGDGAQASVKIVAGSFDGRSALAPPMHSWAARSESDLAIWLVTLEPGARIDLPDLGTDRTERLLAVSAAEAPVTIEDARLAQGQGWLQGGRGAVRVAAGSGSATLLVLQGVALDEPVVQHGPFVMNTTEEIMTAMDDYRRTAFGGWPWPDPAPVHPREQSRFARFGDGRLEEPPAA